MPDPDSARVMAAIDKLSKPMRELAHEYGHNVVIGMIADGHKNPAKLRVLLEAWREQRQAEIARTNWFERFEKTSAAPPIAPDAPPAFSVPANLPAPQPSRELSLTDLFPDI
jgi:hypothetical protein